MYLVILEGQQHQIPDEIASDDHKLLTLFSTVNPALANAEIKRNGTQVELMARKGTKGHSLPVLDLLQAALPHIDPAVAVCNALQNHAFRVGLDAENADRITQRIEQALAESDHQAKARKATLEALAKAKPQSVVVRGF
ncbi:hypothetical protein GFS31_41320 (plasmid) [Leptolyngbya sp. BL0902]|uniref:hypothetical protein n=1 Tax=Leptolyngbya sp. BL0902 TaxID=1115757 RepID=UPI0018E7C5C1|nr:hypothetical protein [Leptolyngbya sp. BL0902]QQE67419.1 hypothetical protein GFS31_41320 [Leptolyngbya sp. BL0902]